MREKRDYPTRVALYASCGAAAFVALWVLRNGKPEAVLHDGESETREISGAVADSRNDSTFRSRLLVDDSDRAEFKPGRPGQLRKVEGDHDRILTEYARLLKDRNEQADWRVDDARVLYNLAELLDLGREQLLVILVQHNELSRALQCYRELTSMVEKREFEFYDVRERICRMRLNAGVGEKFVYPIDPSTQRYLAQKYGKQEGRYTYRVVSNEGGVVTAQYIAIQAGECQPLDTAASEWQNAQVFRRSVLSQMLDPIIGKLK